MVQIVGREVKPNSQKNFCNLRFSSLLERSKQFLYVIIIIINNNNNHNIKNKSNKKNKSINVSAQRVTNIIFEINHEQRDAEKSFHFPVSVRNIVNCHPIFKIHNV
jgi:hypothetical protein